MTTWNDYFNEHYIFALKMLRNMKTPSVIYIAEEAEDNAFNSVLVIKRNKKNKYVVQRISENNILLNKVFDNLIDVLSVGYRKDLRPTEISIECQGINIMTIKDFTKEP